PGDGAAHGAVLRTAARRRRPRRGLAGGAPARAGGDRATVKERWLAPAVIGRLAEGDEALGRHLRQLAAMPDGYRPFAHPFYWGAFICQGDTAPLPAEGGFRV